MKKVWSKLDDMTKAAIATLGVYGLVYLTATVCEWICTGV